MKFINSGIYAAIAALALCPNTAFAQFDTRGGAVTEIRADNAEYEGSKTILTGAVDVRQGDVRILADRMTVFTNGGSVTDSNFSRIVAEGNFYYLTGEQEVRGQRGVYSRETDTFEVSGDVILRQEDGSVVTGDTLYYNLTEKSARVVGTCKGRKCGSTGRVKILIQSNPAARENLGANTGRNS